MISVIVSILIIQVLPDVLHIVTANTLHQPPPTLAHAVC